MRRWLAQRGKTALLETLLQRQRATDRREQLDGGNVERIRQRHTQTNGSITEMIVIFRTINSGWCREPHRHVSHYARRRRAVLEGEQISERFEGRSGGTRGPRSIHLSVRRRPVVFRPNQREHVAGTIFDYHDGAIPHMLVTQLCDSAAQRLAGKRR